MLVARRQFISRRATPVITPTQMTEGVVTLLNVDRTIPPLYEIREGVRSRLSSAPWLNFAACSFLSAMKRGALITECLSNMEISAQHWNEYASCELRGKIDRTGVVDCLLETVTKIQIASASSARTCRHASNRHAVGESGLEISDIGAAAAKSLNYIRAAVAGACSR